MAEKKKALICPTCERKAFARLPRLCGGILTPFGVEQDGSGPHTGHVLTPMVSAALYHSRKASGVNPAPVPPVYPRGGPRGDVL